MCTHPRSRLVVEWLVGVSQIEDDSAVRPTATTLWEFRQEVDAAVEAQAAIWVDVNPLCLEVSRGVDNADITGLDEVVGNEEVLLIGGHLDVMGSDNALVLVRVVETLDVVEVGDVERGDVVAKREREVGELAVVSDVRVDGQVVAGAWAEVEEELGDTLLALGVLAEGVDDPDLAGADGGSDSSALLVARDEFDVLDTLAIGDGDRADDLAGAQLPQAEGVGLLDTVDGSRLEDGDWDDEVRGQDDVVLEINGEAMGAELLAENIEGGRNIFGPFVDDVEIGIGFDETAWRRADSRAHVSDEETTIRLCADLIHNGGKNTAVALLELWRVRVAGVKVERSILCSVNMDCFNRR